MPTIEDSSARVSRRMPVGAEVVPGEGVHFRVWAPRRTRVEAVISGGPGAGSSFELAPEPGGYFSAAAPACAPGSLYRFRLDGADAFPDPASRFQPEGPHGPSEVIDAAPFQWSDHHWRGRPLQGQVIYEMHIGSFTPEGSYASAAAQFEQLAETGITVLELMPVAEFPGRFGWGYDGVDLFAPTRLYGRPDDLRRFVDRAHNAGLAVILDVVYNHLGPDANYLREFSAGYFTDRYHNEWGDAINFDGPQSAPVREFFLSNAAYWIEEFHMDGLRLDATQSIHDKSPEHILTAISRRVRQAAPGRATIIVNENEPQDTGLVRPIDDGGCGMDGLWNDDFHHSAIVAATGRNEAYYTDYLGSPQEFISAAKYGYLYQGQMYRWQGKRRGRPSFGIPPAAFVNYLQNHDQVANSARGDRLHTLTSPGRYKALTALLLLAPGTPMLFQGQEFAASTPFLYFADHKPDLAATIREGRVDFVSQFRSLATPEMRPVFSDPGDPETFRRSKLDFADRDRNRHYYALHRDLLRLRREDKAFQLQRPGAVDGAVLGPEAFVLRFFGDKPAEDRLLVVNLGRDLHLNPAPEPLLGPPDGMRWRTLWSSEDPAYLGLGTAPVDTIENWRLPGHAAVVLWPTEPEDEPKKEAELEKAVEESKDKLKAGEEQGWLT